MFKICWGFNLRKLLSFCLSDQNPFINEQSDHKVEVGINSISQISDDEYIISVYAINPYNPIAGIQFKIEPSDLFEVIEVYGGRSQDEDFEIHFNKTGTILGFSMVANTIDPSIIVTGPSRLNSNILLFKASNMLYLFKDIRMQ